MLATYLMIIFLCWDEIQFQARSFEVQTRAEVVGDYSEGRQLIRYEYRDPVTRQKCQNTIPVYPSEIADFPNVTVQVIRGETTRSRLASQARPLLLTAVVGIHSIFFVFICGTIVYLIREAHHVPLTRQQRAMVQWRRKKELEAIANSRK